MGTMIGLIRYSYSYFYSYIVNNKYSTLSAMSDICTAELMTVEPMNVGIMTVRVMTIGQLALSRYFYL